MNLTPEQQLKSLEKQSAAKLRTSGRIRKSPTERPKRGILIGKKDS